MVDIRRSKFWRRPGRELDSRLRGNDESGGFQPSSPGRGGFAGRRGVTLTMAGPPVWPSARHLPCQGRMRVLRPLSRPRADRLLTGKPGADRPCDGDREWEAGCRISSVILRRLGFLCSIRRFVKRSEVPAFAGTTTNGNKRSEAELVSACADGEWWFSAILPLQGRCWARREGRRVSR